MLECPHCKTPYAPEDRYCNQCGMRVQEIEVMDSGARTQKSIRLVDVHYNLGLVYFKKGQYRQALKSWEKALAIEPESQAVQERIEQVKTCLHEGENG